jgi:ribosomal protein S6--L-glutamate ligase
VPASRLRGAGRSPPSGSWPRTARRCRGRWWSRAAPVRAATWCAWFPARRSSAGLLPEWGDEPVVAQEFAANDGFDIKVWVIGADLSAARRRSALESVDKTADERLDPADLPAEWVRTARDAGAALGLQLYGADLLIADGRPVVVDVNPFPGFRGAHQPADSLLRFLSTLTTARTVTA